MIKWTSFLWKMNIHLAKKWPEMIVKWPFYESVLYRNGVYLELTYRIKGEYGVHIKLLLPHRSSKIFEPALFEKSTFKQKTLLKCILCKQCRLKIYHKICEIVVIQYEHHILVWCVKSTPIGFFVIIRECYQIKLWRTF